MPTPTQIEGNNVRDHVSKEVDRIRADLGLHSTAEAQATRAQLAAEADRSRKAIAALDTGVHPVVLMLWTAAIFALGVLAGTFV